MSELQALLLPNGITAPVATSSFILVELSLLGVCRERRKAEKEMRSQAADRLENKHKTANQNRKKFLGKVKELYFCGLYPGPFAPPFHSPGAPKRVCLVEIGLHRETQAQVSGCRGRAQFSASGGCEDSELFPSLPAADASSR